MNIRKSAEQKRLDSYTKHQSETSSFAQNMRSRLNSLLSKPFSLIRRGPERVIMIPDVARRGNWLYEWNATYIFSQRQKGNWRVSLKSGMDDWSVARECLMLWQYFQLPPFSYSQILLSDIGVLIWHRQLTPLLSLPLMYTCGIHSKIHLLLSTFHLGLH